MEEIKSQKAAPSKKKGGKYAQKGRKKQASKKKSKLEKLLLLTLAAAVLVVAYLGSIVLNRGGSYQFSGAGTQYYGGNSVQVNVGAQIKTDDDGTLVLEQNGEATDINLPVYLDDSAALVTAREMVYYEPRGGNCRRVLPFSTVSYELNGGIRVARERKEVQVERGFLYDGNDFYIFMEPVSVALNDHIIDLPALSYVEAVHGSYIMVFDYETKECTMEPVDGPCIARIESGEYELSLLGDSMTKASGVKILLVSQPDLMEPMT